MPVSSSVPRASSRRAPRAENLRVTRLVRQLAVVPLMLVTAYLVMERSHAEELGSGVRATAEVLRGERTLSPLTWAALLAVVLALVWAARSARPVRVPRPTVR